MNILIDTHVLIWALENNPTLSDTARNSIVRADNIIFVSSASIWEISIKKHLAKLETPDNLREELELHRFTPLPITHRHAELAGRLPDIHRDPFDHMLIAQAIVEKLTLVTRDKYIAQYKVKIIAA
ncbi:MAG: type II toxin-antitoxin system VapC family toxin [Deltaproteobacteria bacterium]|nr:type II toxin-antitoxin system VapC family toxin [Candidatus Anaeroferrophillacea bacterium]